MLTMETMETTERKGISVEYSDVSGQNLAIASDVPLDFTIGEVNQGLISRMGLPRNGADGEAIVYQAWLEREGRHLRTNERVGEALRDKDRLVLQPNIDAGSPRVRAGARGEE